jgi:hypothetical protein
MRLTKAATAGLAVVAVLAIAGTGFAAFTTSAYIQGNAQAGTLGPYVWGPYPTHSASGTAVCSVTRGTTNYPGDTLFLSAGNLGPDTQCTYADVLDNLGTLPGNTTAQITSASGGLCSVLDYQDLFFSPAVVIGSGGQVGATSNTVYPGPSLIWAGDITLPGSVGSAHQGQSCSFTVTLTGTAGT